MGVVYPFRSGTISRSVRMQSRYSFNVLLQTFGDEFFTTSWQEVQLPVKLGAIVVCIDDDID